MLNRHRQNRFDFARKRKVLALGMMGVVLTQWVILFLCVWHKLILLTPITEAFKRHLYSYII